MMGPDPKASTRTSKLSNNSMARIFNSIRNRFLKENRLTRYLVYAIGEILLVVIGILIALQVNNGNMARLDRQKEMKYLRSLKLDLQVDLVNLEEMIALRNNKTASAVELLSYPTPTDLGHILELDSLIGIVFGWKDYHPRTNTLKELTNSGDLNMIRNDSIRTILLDIEERNAVLVTSVAHMRREYDMYLYDRNAVLRERTPLLDHKASFEKGQAIRDTLVTPQRQSELLAQAEALLKDLQVINGLKLAAGNNSYIRRQYEVIQSDTERLLRLIDKDLNGH